MIVKRKYLNASRLAEAPNQIQSQNSARFVHLRFTINRHGEQNSFNRSHNSLWTNSHTCISGGSTYYRPLKQSEHHGGHTSLSQIFEGKIHCSEDESKWNYYYYYYYFIFLIKFVISMNFQSSMPWKLFRVPYLLSIQPSFFIHV